MIKTILIVITVVLAMLGLTELIHGIRLAVLAPKKAYKIFSLVWLEPEMAHQQMRFVCEQSNWFGQNFAENIIAVTSQIDGEELKSCRSIAEKNGILCSSAEELEKIVTNISKV